jgi:hypothetical protein
VYVRATLVKADKCLSFAFRLSQKAYPLKLERMRSMLEATSFLFPSIHLALDAVQAKSLDGIDDLIKLTEHLLSNVNGSFILDIHARAFPLGAFAFKKERHHIPGLSSILAEGINFKRPNVHLC